MRLWKALCAVCAATLITGNAGAAGFIVTYKNSYAIQSDNDFRLKLDDPGVDLFRYTTRYATVAVDGPGIVTFDYIAAESGYNNKFYMASTTPLAAPDKIEGNHGWDINGRLIGTRSFTAAGGAPLDVYFWNGLHGDQKLLGTPGADSFGIFMPQNEQLAYGQTLGSYESATIYFGFDDQRVHPDDNHDDFIVRARFTAFPGPIPEPGTWAMMIVGFGAVGAALRRNRQTGGTALA